MRIICTVQEADAGEHVKLDMANKSLDVVKSGCACFSAKVQT